MALGGAAVGLTLGTLSQEAWSPAGSDALFAGVLGVESLVLAIADRERRGDGGAVDARFNDHEKHRWEHEA